MSSMHTALEVIYGKPFVTSELLVAGLSRYPTTPDQHVIVLTSVNLFSLSTRESREVMIFVHHYAGLVKTFSRVQRCGLAYDGFKNIHIIPMHGLTEHWNPIRATPTPRVHSYPGFLWTKSSSQLSEDELNMLQRKIINCSGWQKPDHTFFGASRDTNLFAQLIRGEIPQWRIWEDKSHVAFLTPFPNTPAFSVLIPREHLSSDILSLSDQEFDDLFSAIREVAAVLMRSMKTTRVGLFFEGFEIDYAHAKLVPVLDDSAEIEGASDEYHETYAGYITTRLGPRQDDEMLDQRHTAWQEYFDSQYSATVKSFEQTVID